MGQTWMQLLLHKLRRKRFSARTFFPLCASRVLGCLDPNKQLGSVVHMFTASPTRNAVGDDKTFLLAQQFEEYEQQMKRDDAERWHGKGLLSPMGGDG